LANIFFQLPLINKGATLIGGNNFIRSDILKKTGGYNTDLTFYGEDTDTAKRVSAHGKVIFSPKVVMKTSARRFKSEGTFNLMFKYWFHFFKHILKKR
jgi:GT2 family glycosyltransferase